MGRRWITAAGQEWRIRLRVVISRQGEQSREGVISHEGELESRISTRSRRGSRSDVTRNGCLLAERNVEAQIQVVVHTRGSAGCPRIFCILGIVGLTRFRTTLRSLDLTAAASIKEAEVL